MANISDVARLAGVSTATVSAVLNGRNVVKPQTRRVVLEAIKKLNYHPNLQARNLARGHSGILGLVISDIINPFFAEIAQVVQAEANLRGYQVFISATQFSLERLRAAVAYMVGMRAAGLVIMTTEMDDETLGILRARKIPAIFEDVGIVDRHTSKLRIDYEGGINQIVRTLADLGHRRVLFLENPPSGEAASFFSVRLRREAFQTAIAHYPGMQYEQLTVVGPPFVAGLRAAAEALERFIFTAAVVNADPIALGFLKGLRNLGRRVPEDISVVGFDNSPGCEYADPPLASVEISREQIGRLAVDTLVRMIEKGDRGSEIRIGTELIRRASLAPAPVSGKLQELDRADEQPDTRPHASAVAKLRAKFANKPGVPECKPARSPAGSATEAEPG